MSRRRLLAFSCHALVASGLALAGARYLTAVQPMPHHLETLGQPWSALDLGTRQLVLALLHGSGAAMLSGALALGMILLMPWRRGERWARHGLPALALAGLSPLLVVALQLARRGTHAPWWLVVAAMLLTVAGWALTPGGGDRRGSEPAPRISAP